jgi:regulator of sigma E protease
MSLIVSTPLHIFLAIVALGLLIIVHEGGHYLVARLSGMRVDRFSIGFGPKLWSFKRGETVYQIAVIPLGGFVQIAGLNPADEPEKTTVEKDGKQVEVDRTSDPRMYYNRPVWQRFATIFAGPATNYIFAALLMVVAFLAYGVPVAGKTPMVMGVVAGKPAAAAGFQAGDEISTVDGQKVAEVSDVAPIINKAGNRAVVVEVVREGQPKSLTVTPAKDGNDWRIGIQLDAKEVYEPASALTCIKQGLLFPVTYSAFILHGFKEIFAGRQKAEFSGPIGIVKVMKNQIAQGMRATMQIIAIISVYLGLFNLLPLPALDGGRLVFLGWEAVSRRRVNQRVEATVHMVGILVLLCFLVYVSMGDVGLKLFKH